MQFGDDPAQLLDLGRMLSMMLHSQTHLLLPKLMHACSPAETQPLPTRHYSGYLPQLDRANTAQGARTKILAAVASSLTPTQKK